MKFPLRTATREYLEKRAERVGERTLDNEKRILIYLVEEIEAGKVKGLTTTNPYKMGEKDVKAILDFLKRKELENETTMKYLQFINGLLIHCGNRSLDDLRFNSPHLFPKRTRKPIRYLTENQLNNVRNAAEDVEGWKGSVLRFLTAAYPGTGLRPSELRTAHIEDLDTNRWTLRVRHPKGEGTFGARRTVAIMPPFRKAILLYLDEREMFLRTKGMNSKYLVPALVKGKDEPYSSNHFRKIKKELEEATGIEFRLKDFRSTFATLTRKKDRGSLPDVSEQLGHSSLVVTQQFYSDIDANDVGQRLAEAWGQKPSDSGTYPGTRTKTDLDSKSDKNVLIKPKEYITGYN
jgi:integrase